MNRQAKTLVTQRSNMSPGNQRFVKFTFLDPIWGWLTAARRQDPLDLHWKPITQPQVPVYGGGVQYGQAFLQAARTCGAGMCARRQT